MGRQQTEAAAAKGSTEEHHPYTGFIVLDDTVQALQRVASPALPWHPHLAKARVAPNSHTPTVVHRHMLWTSGSRYAQPAQFPSVCMLACFVGATIRPGELSGNQTEAQAVRGCSQARSLSASGFVGDIGHYFDSNLFKVAMAEVDAGKRLQPAAGSTSCSESTGVVAFARAPIPGTVKTRLAAGIGPEKSCEFYEACAGQVLKEVARCAFLQPAGVPQTLP